MNIFNHIRAQILDLLSLYKTDALQNIAVEPPRDASHGDVSTNAAMVLAKHAGKNPRELAEQFSLLFRQIKEVDEISIAGAGFINFRLKPEFLLSQIDIILNSDEGGTRAGLPYGCSNIGHAEKINIEYVSVNPTGPLHIGHARGAVFGDVLASLLKAVGYDVTKEYYINDAGGQINVLMDSIKLRQEGKEIPQGFYPGEYLIPIAESLRGSTDLRKDSVAAMMALIRENLAAANISHDIFTSEFELTQKDLPNKALEKLKAKGLIYQGTLEPPKGKLPDDWEEREQTLFKSTEFGDDVDRAIKKSDGSFTYFAGDLGYHLDKINRGYSKIINIMGQDHAGYVKRLKAGVEALSDDEVECEIKLVNLVKLLENGELYKMSKRAGNFIFIEDVIEKVGIDALRFIMLTRKNDAPLDFDLAKVVEQSKDNPVFYVQYAHARCCSVLRSYHNVILGPEPIIEQVDDVKINPRVNAENDANLKLLGEQEIALIKKLIEYPRIVELAANHYEPHRIAFYLQELAAEFHSLWATGGKFITDDKELSAARVALVKAVKIVIRNGLEIFGVTAPQEMR